MIDTMMHNNNTIIQARSSNTHECMQDTDYKEIYFAHWVKSGLFKKTILTLFAVYD